MPEYKYQVRTKDGQSREGVMSGESAAAVAASLRGQGLRVVAVDSTGGLSRSALGKAFGDIGARQPSQKDVLDFTLQLAVMVRAGINLRSALEGIGEQCPNKRFGRIVMQLKSDVESGKSFSEALSKHPKLFSALYINMVRASEMSGSFAEMLERIAGYISQEIETRKMVVGASIYPGIIGVMAVSVTVFLLSFVLPKFYTIFEGKEDVLPWATNFLMMLSRMLTEQWPFILGGLVVAGGLFYGFSQTHTGAFWIDKTKLTMPVVRAMFRSLYISRSLQTMGQLTNAGVPVLDTIAITGDISGNKLYEGMWGRVYKSVKQGREIAPTLSDSNLMPKSVVQMIGAGEESGRLGEVLDEISVYYAKQLKDQIKAVTGMIEPVMIVIMGSIVGFIAMAIILPIFKMSQIVS